MISGLLEKTSKLWGEEMERLGKRARNIRRLLGSYEPQVGLTPARVVYQRNKMKLLRYERPAHLQGTPRGGMPVLIVPSIINRHYILDLQPQKSLIEYLVGQGLDVFLVTWGRPGSEDRYLTFDDHIEMLIGAAVRQTCRLAQSERLHLFGHCIGGMMTLVYAALHPERIASLLNLTSPVDLRHGGMLERWTQFMNVDRMVDALGNAPWPLLQASFHLLTPLGMLQKTAWFYERLWDEQSIDTFLALETWANDNVSIPGEFFRTLIKELYQHNALYEETLIVAGRRVELSQIKAPVLNIAAQGDHIAPVPSVIALADRLPQTQNLILPGGHIGAVVSYRASKKLWPAIVEFFRAVESDSWAQEDEEARRQQPSKGEL